MEDKSYLQKANTAFNNSDYVSALQYYENASGELPELDRFINSNVYLTKKRLAKRYKKYYGIYEEHISDLIDEIGGEDAMEAFPALREIEVKEKDPLVSIVMPTWNRGHIIDHAVKSVLDQTYNKWELIICDDASEDNTEEIVKNLNDPRIKYEKLSKTNGAVARNHGLKRAVGNIYAFLDSDNVWSPNYLEEIVAAHEKSNSAIVYTGYLDCQIEGRTFSAVKKKFRIFSYLDISFKNYIDLNTVSFKPFIYFELGGFDPGLPRQQDWDLLVRYTAHYPPYGVKKALVLYRRNQEWGQVTITKRHIDTRKIILEKNKRLIEKYKKRRLPKEVDLKAVTKEKAKKFSTIAIKISAPNEGVAYEWGDYHFAHQLGKALYKYGWNYVVHCQDKWYEEKSDVNLIIRGRHRFNVAKSDAVVNYLWIISHPDRLVNGELDDYSHIFVASEVFVEKVRKMTKTPASVLHQATDPDVFKPAKDKLHLPEKVVFIGNSRNEFRKMVKWSEEGDVPIALWGSRWEQFVSADKIQGQYIPNSEVAKYYSSCDILLNDHWDTMRTNGFISNRIFDASAAGAFIISDEVLGIEKIFGNNVAVANTKEKFLNLIKKYKDSPDKRREMAKNACEIVLKNHTFLARAYSIDFVIRKDIM